MDIEQTLENLPELSAGNNITRYNDQLHLRSPLKLFDFVRNAPQELVQQIATLRTIATIDPKRYRELKTQLPYVVAARFKPALRKKEHFAATDYLILDVDHVSKGQESMAELKGRLVADGQLMLLFESPGGDGLKLMFRLAETCFDATLFSLIYKGFATDFGNRHGISALIDIRTHDVSRACFLAADVNAYFNPVAETVLSAGYVPTDDPALFSAELAELNRDAQQLAKQEPDKLPATDVLAQIKSQLLPTARKPKLKQIFVPEEIGSITEAVARAVAVHGIELIDAAPINYGNKLIFGLGLKRAELNVFYGKRGFTVVRTPKNGTDPVLADVVYNLVSGVLYG